MSSINAKAHARKIKSTRIEALNEAAALIRTMVEADPDTYPYYKDTLSAQENAIWRLAQLTMES